MGYLKKSKLKINKKIKLQKKYRNRNKIWINTITLVLGGGRPQDGAFMLVENISKKYLAYIYFVA